MPFFGLNYSGVSGILATFKIPPFSMAPSQIPFPPPFLTSRVLRFQLYPDVLEKTEITITSELVRLFLASFL
jgi:hypothetical protein